jgi:hypothetical protein
MQRLEVSGAVRPLYGSLGVKWVNKRSGPTLELNKPQVSWRKREINWTLVRRPTDFDIAVIWNNVTSYEVTCHLAGNMLKEEREV